MQKWSNSIWLTWLCFEKGLVNAAWRGDGKGRGGNEGGERKNGVRTSLTKVGKTFEFEKKKMEQTEYQDRPGRERLTIELCENDDDAKKINRKKISWLTMRRSQHTHTPSTVLVSHVRNQVDHRACPDKAYAHTPSEGKTEKRTEELDQTKMVKVRPKVAVKSWVPLSSNLFIRLWAHVCCSDFCQAAQLRMGRTIDQLIELRILNSTKGKGKKIRTQVCYERRMNVVEMMGTKRSWRQRWRQTKDFLCSRQATVCLPFGGVVFVCEHARDANLVHGQVEEKQAAGQLILKWWCAQWPFIQNDVKTCACFLFHTKT